METGSLRSLFRAPAIFRLLLFTFLMWTVESTTSIVLATSSEPSAKTGVILAFGDSLTAGLGVSIDEAYPAVLARRLADAGFNYQIINAGVSGETTAGGLRRLEWVLKRHTPDLVILELGANDGLRGLDLQQMQKNLSRIIERFQKEDITVILAGMKIPPNYGKAYSGAFENIFTALAEDYKIGLIPFFLEGVAAIPALNQRDGIHPNAKGYEVVIDHIFPIVVHAIKNFQ